MTIHLTYDRAVELLDRAVAEKGAGYVYEEETCTYVNRYGEPICIVGHVLHYAAGEVPFDFYSSMNEALVHRLVEAGILDADERTVLLLSLAQMGQDLCATWSVAVEWAKERVAEE